MRHSSYHTPLPPVPDRPGSAGSPVFRRGCSPAVFSCCAAWGSSPPAAISQQVSAWLHPPAASTPASPPRRTSPCRRKTTPSRGVFLSLDQLADAQTLADGYDGVILPMKTAGGALGYVSALPLAADAGASSGDPDRNEVLRALNDPRPVHRGPGLLPSGQCSGQEEPGLSLHRVSGSPGWTKAARAGWTPPSPRSNPTSSACAGSWPSWALTRSCSPTAVSPPRETWTPSAPWKRRRKPWRPSAASSRAPWLTRLSPLSVMGQRDSVTADPVSGQTTALLATFGRVWTQAEDQEALAAFDPVVLPAVS